MYVSSKLFQGRLVSACEHIGKNINRYTEKDKSGTKLIITEKKEKET